MRPALRNYDAPDGCAAIGTRLSCSAVYVVQLLKRAAFSSTVDVVRDGGAAVLDREMKHAS